ncbi:FBD-associated F-box protein At3g52670-like isoform X1 [Fagus crenata]
MANNKNCDRISNLPDSLLCHILSFLETKETVATSTLSTRWKPLWTLVPNLDLEMYGFEWNKCYRFPQIVSKVWDLRHANPLKQFRLCWRFYCDPILVDKWLCATIVRHLEELDLNIYPNLAFNLPTNLFNYCKTLVVLKLRGNIVLNTPSSSSSLGFPSLKILHLHSVKYANHDSFLILLSFCPILQDLSIDTNGSHYWDQKYHFKIFVPTLKRLHLNMPNILSTPADDINAPTLEINTPALESLNFIGYLDEDVLVENLSNLVEAVLHIDDGLIVLGNCIMNFIMALSNVKSLTLGSFTTECLCCTSNFDPPIFHNLAFLDFCVGPGEWQQASLAFGKWNVLPLFLQRAPNLEVLVFDMEKRNCSNVSNAESSASTLEWLFEKVPNCLSLHLTAFHVKGYKGSKDELELVKYILEWARVLKTMTVSFCCLNLEKKFRALQEILMLPKQSTTCKIAFTD